MPAATRWRAATAALGLVLLVPGAIVGRPGGSAAAVPAAGVSLVVASGGRTPLYRVEVRNETREPVTTTVRQTFPRGVVPKTISNGGRAAPAGMAGTEVTWDLRLPARGAATLRTGLGPVSTVPLAAPACAFVDGGTTAYDCATAVWGLRSGEGPPPWWQRPAGVAIMLGALVLLTAAVWAWRFLRRRTRVRAATGGGTHRAPAVRPARRSAKGRPPGRPGAPPAATGAAAPAPRRSPPTWQVVGGAALILLVTIGLVVWFGGTQVAALGPTAQSTSGAWVGTTQTGRVGMTMRDNAFAFTVYRLDCSRAQPARQCTATVGLHNTSGTSQMWHAGMQRAYLPTGNWVTTDEAATRAANRGQDIFTHPIPAGGRLLAPVVFSLPGAAPAKIQLRGGAFSAGISVIP